MNPTNRLLRLDKRNLKHRLFDSLPGLLTRTQNTFPALFTTRNVIKSLE